MKKYVYFILIGAIVLLSGCGAKGPQFSTFKKPTKDMGIVYIYRPSNMQGAVLSHTIKDKESDKLIGELKNGGYIYKEMKPGIKTIQHRSGSGVLAKNTIKISKNKIVCLKNYFTMYNMYEGKFFLEKVNDDICMHEIKDTKASFN